MKGYVYLIKSAKHRYLGSTPDVDIRLDEHNRGVTTATRNKGPWMLEAKWEFDTIQEARSVEYRIKRMKKSLNIENVGRFIGWFRNNII